MNKFQEFEGSLIQEQYYGAFDSLIEDLSDIGDESEYPVSLNTIELI